MPFPIRCSGRNYPNGPTVSRVGFKDRSPYVFQAKYLTGIGAIPIAQQNIWHNCMFSGAVGFGLNPRTNWNVTPVISNFVLNVSQRWDGPTNQFRIVVEVQTGGFAGIRRSSFATDWGDDIDASLFSGVDGASLLPIASGFPPTVADDFISLRLGEYQFLPADSCILP